MLFCSEIFPCYRKVILLLIRLEANDKPMKKEPNRPLSKPPELNNNTTNLKDRNSLILREVKKIQKDKKEKRISA